MATDILTLKYTNNRTSITQGFYDYNLWWLLQHVSVQSDHLHVTDVSKITKKRQSLMSKFGYDSS
jgi:hypothetical protein